MDNMEKMMQQILAQINSYQKKAKASMAKLEEKMDDIMEAFLTKIDTIRENTTAWNEATEKTA
jgi:hypothetical protein